MPAALLLPLGFGGLLVVAVSLILGTVTVIGSRTTTELVRDKAALLVDAVHQRINLHAGGAEKQTIELAELARLGVLDVNDTDELLGHLEATLAVAPQFDVAFFAGLDGMIIGVSRQRQDGADEPYRFQSRHAEMEDVISARMRELVTSGEQFTPWGPPTFNVEKGQTYFYARHRVEQDGAAVGAFVLAVSVDELSEHLRRLTQIHPGIEPFILYGRDLILAHPLLRQADFAASPHNPLPSREHFDDPVLRVLWDPSRRETVSVEPVLGFDMHVIRAAGDRYLTVLQRRTGSSPEPLTIGANFKLSDIGSELRKFRHALSIGVVISLIGTMIALLAGLMVARHPQRLAAAAIYLRDRGPEQVPTLPRSRIREMDIAGLAFNKMAAGLRRAERVRDTFGKYVPRQVAEALMRQGGRLAVQERVATVLFTDIQGFSTISEQVEPEALIDMLNEYFDAVTGPVEAHGGVISQYQGDAILATFNMPIDDPDHATHAVEAAMGIQATLQGRHFGDGYEFITRVGINTGRIVGGAVGSKGRLSYTVHGDNVNVAARIEEMNKQFGTRILVAEATVKLCRDRFEFQRLGELPIRGRARGEVLYTVRKP